MKILKLLSKKSFPIVFILFFGMISYAEEQPVDIWDIDKKELENESLLSNTTNDDGKKKNHD